MGLQPNTLYFGDNLEVLREHFPDECVDLIYLDPPFNSKRDYNYIYRSVASEDDTAQIKAFQDTWSFEGAAEAFYEVTATNEPVAKLLEGLRQAFGDTSLLGYLSVMALRLRELHRVLQPTGTLYLHCDTVASYYLKLVLDSVFGERSFVNDISWKRTTTKSDWREGATNWPRIHDVLLHYAKDAGRIGVFNQPFARYPDEYVRSKYRHLDSDGRRYMLDNLTAPGAGTRGHPQYEFMGVTRYWRYNKAKMERLVAEGRIVQPAPGRVPRYKRYLDEVPGIAIGDVWEDIPPINSMAAERLGFPTQKPLALLERVVLASSKEGDLVLDPFCGCGTAVVAAQKLGRKWIGIDITTLAVTLIKRRLMEHFPKAFPNPDSIPVVGLPVDVAGARELALGDRHAFEHWALTLVGAAPKATPKKKGADKGIDGEFTWRDGEDQLRRCIVSVKSGHVNVSQVRDLVGTMDREKASMGLLVTLEPPSGPMRTEAAGAGRYEVEGTTGVKAFPRVQIVTIEELLSGKEPDVPRQWRIDPFRKAVRIPKPEQELLELGRDV